MQNFERTFYSLLKTISNKIIGKAKLAKYRIHKLSQLQSKKFKIYFKSEGNIQIKLPKISFLDILSSGFFEKLDREIKFSSRPQKELLLRIIVYDLLQKGYLDKNKSIIDIGCQLADNALIWAKLINNNAVVHAIEPSHENLKFAKEIAIKNEVSNINWIEAVCSDKEGMMLDFTGEVGLIFNKANPNSNNFLISTTLDKVINNSKWRNISLMHLDVEGFEEQVMKGAENIINQNRPVIIFEQHICKDNPIGIINSLKSKNYKIFMINEILPWCDPDCRNFIAFDNEKELPNMKELKHNLGRDENIWYATLGPALELVK